MEKNVPKLNLFLSLNGYQDINPTNNPMKNNFKWSNDMQGIEIKDPYSRSFLLPANENLVLFSEEVVISDDNTTTYDLDVKGDVVNGYSITYNSGTAPLFRVPRNVLADNTTEVKLTKNGVLMKLEASAGTPFDFSSVVVGDEVRFDFSYNPNNLGKFKVLSKTSTTLTFENVNGVDETSIYGSDINKLYIYSSTGVQVGQKVKINSGFSSVSHGTYEIVDVTPTSLVFISTKTLPIETALEKLNIYKDSKKFIYIESSEEVSLVIDGVDAGNIRPIVIGTSKRPGVFLRSCDIYKCEIIGNITKNSEICYILAE